MTEFSKELMEVMYSHPIVYRIIHSGGTMEDCVIALAKHNEELSKQIFHLYSSVPPAWRGPLKVGEEDAHLPS
jgi:hypothetical protein